MFKMFPKLPKMKMTSTSVGYYIPLFKEKLKKNMPLHATVQFKNINFKFGQYDTDVIVSYTLCIKFREDDGKKHKKDASGKTIDVLKDLFYDELAIVTTGSVKTKDDVVYM